MRATRQAIAEAIRTDPAVAELVPGSQVFAVERATLPSLPAVECIAVSTERVDTGPMVLHQIAIEITVASPSEDDADALLDQLVAAVRRRVSDAEQGENPIRLVTGQTAVCALGGTRWSTSASGSSGVIRGRVRRRERGGQRVTHGSRTPNVKPCDRWVR